MKQQFSERLSLIMKVRKMKQSELSKKTGLAHGTISNYLLGKYVAKGKNLRLLANALDVNAGWLECIDGVPMQPNNDLIRIEPWEEEYAELNHKRYAFSDLEYTIIERYRMSDPKTQKIILSLLDLEEMAELEASAK